MNNYLINQTCAFKGEWWHSTDDATRFAGELKYIPADDKIELVIWGESELDEIDFYNDTFLGETTEGIKITLSHLHRSHTKGTISQNPRYVHTVQIAGVVIVGMHFSRTKDIHFPNVAVCFMDQNLFIQRNGFDTSFEEQKEIISYAPIDEIQLHSDDVVAVTLSFTYTAPLTGRLSQQAMIAQREYFHVEAAQDGLEYHSLVEQITMLRDFLTFSINKNVYVDECYFYFYEPVAATKVMRKVSFLDRAFWRKNVEGGHHAPQNVMFTLEDLENGKVRYRDWIDIYNTKNPATAIFFGLKYRRETFIDELFLDLMHILEDYHRHSADFRQNIEPDRQFDDKIADILNVCPEKHKKWLRNALKHSNEINLEWRINDILKYFSLIISKLIPDKKARNQTVKKMVASRNYLTHRSERAKEKAIENYHNFFYLNDLIRIMMTMLILKDLGMTLQEIDDKMYCVPEFVNRLDVEWEQIE